jgi:hypothetical protein
MTILQSRLSEGLKTQEFGFNSTIAFQNYTGYMASHEYRIAIVLWFLTLIYLCLFWCRSNLFALVSYFVSKLYIVYNTCVVHL